MPSTEVIEKLQALEKELSTLESGVKQIDKAAEVAKNAAKISQNLQQLLSEIKDLEIDHREALLEMQKKEVEKLKFLYKKSQKSLDEKSEQINLLIESSHAVNKRIADYAEYVEGVDFPGRLDKIDNQISSINIGIGNTQTAIEKNADQQMNEFKALAKVIEENQKTAQEQQEKLKKEISTNRILIAIGILASLGLFAFNFFSQ